MTRADSDTAALADFKCALDHAAIVATTDSWWRGGCESVDLEHEPGTRGTLVVYDIELRDSAVRARH